VIGKGGGRITDVENRLGIDIDVRTHDENPNPGGAGSGGSPQQERGRTVTPEITSRHIRINVDGAQAGQTVEVKAGSEYLFTATVGRGGDIQVSRGSAIAEELERAIDRSQEISVVGS
jgi:ATPase